MRKLVAALFALALLAGLSAVAEARVIRYHSRHPIPAKMGGGFCYIEVPHVHDFGPNDPRLFRVHDEEYYFVGDPSPFGYEGPHYSFYGPHPVAEADVSFGEPVYCYLEGPHSHWYQPVASASFEFRGGAYWYVGAYDPVFYSARPRFVVINEAYRPLVYTRPVVDVRVAPPAFRGTIVAGPPGVRAGAFVGGPAVSAGVHVAVPPPPSVHVGVHVGGPVVREHVVVGGPPARGVVVAHPVARERVVVAPARGPVVAPARGAVHVDNGRHEGWNKPHGKH